MTDLLTPPAIHYHHTGDSEFIAAACGFTWQRGEEAPARFTSQVVDVTCEECRKTLKAAGGMLAA
jgi:hypothetical protein